MVGAIAAQEVIEIVLENFAPKIYNVGIVDAKKLLQQRSQDIELDIDMLEQKI